MDKTTQSQTPALGQCQLNLEAAHKELLAARAAFVKAQERREAAETAYTNSQLTLNKAVESIKQFCHLQPFGL